MGATLNVPSLVADIRAHFARLQSLATAETYREFWATAAAAKGLLRQLPQGGFREQLWAECQALCARMAAEKERWVSEAKKNAEKLEAAIKALRSKYLHEPLFGTSKLLPGFWTAASEVGARFDQVKLLRADRERLWALYSALRADAKRLRQTAIADSTEQRARVEQLLDQAAGLLGQAIGSGEFREVDELLRRALTRLRTGGYPPASERRGCSVGAA